MRAKRRVYSALYTNTPSPRESFTRLKKTIEGFHDAVRTPYALRPGRHVGFFLEQQYGRPMCFNFVSILFEKIKQQHRYLFIN